MVRQTLVTGEAGHIGGTLDHGAVRPNCSADLRFELQAPDRLSALLMSVSEKSAPL
jgi:hypothetical protein